MIRTAIAALLLAAPGWAAPVTQADYAEMSQADIVILGEVHDNPAHHNGQASIITQLAPGAVVFEMLSPAQADIVNAGGHADMEGLGERLDWASSGWPAFALYAPIFNALATTPAVGAALPRDQVRMAIKDGASAVFATDAPDFGLDRPLPGQQQVQREEMQFDAHCAAMPREMMAGMVEAQRLRDAHFSRVALAALETHGAPVIVIAGNGHARRDWGMPAVIATAAPEVRVFAVGFVEEPATAGDPRFDLTLPTAPAVRPDPCDAFNKR